MLIEYLEKLRAHGEWADTRLLASVRHAELNNDDSAPCDLTAVLRELAHIRGAQETWLSRIEGRAPTMPVFPELTAAELKQAAGAVDAGMRRLIATLDELSAMRVIEYSSVAGVGYGTPLLDILMQLLTHGHYHRGKANVALKAAGIAPVSVDYIGWQREAAARSN